MKRWMIKVFLFLLLLPPLAISALWVDSHWRIRSTQVPWGNTRWTFTSMNGKAGVQRTMHYPALGNTFGSYKGRAVGPEWPFHRDLAEGLTHRFFGFGVDRQVGTYSPRTTELMAVIPYWFLTLLTTGMLFISLMQYRCCQRRRKIELSLCPHCGYDLRASKERCPECGRAVPSDISSNPAAPSRK